MREARSELLSYLAEPSNEILPTSAFLLRRPATANLYEEYEIRGVLEEVPKPTEALTKEQRNFINLYRSLRYMRTIFEGKIGSILSEPTKIVSPTIITHKKQFLKTYAGLTQTIPQIYQREELEEFTNMMPIGYIETLHNFIYLIKDILQSQTDPRILW